jgi:hypothetical protein
MQFPWKKRTSELSVVATAPSTTESAPLGKLELVQAEVSADQARISELEAEAHGVGGELAEIASTAAALKIEISQGSPIAGSALDALESRQRAAERRHEGLRLRIATLCAGIEPKKRIAIELAEVRDAQRQDQTVTDLTLQAETMTAEVIHHWRAACATAFDLMTILDGAMGGQLTLDVAHRHQILVLNNDIYKKFFDATLEQVNKNWAFARAESFHALRVVPGKPRNEIARAS